MPGRADARSDQPPAADDPLWTVSGLVDAWSVATAHGAGWLARAPAYAASYGTRMQLYIRDLAAESRSLMARLLPFVPQPPDLSPLVASPVPGVESSGFGWRRDPLNRRSKFHRGTDFRADRGTPVFAAGPGLVAFTGRQHGYGNVIYIDHGGGLVTRYAHLSRIEVSSGAAVDAGGRIGRVGATGRATGPHLHFEVRLEGRAVDPSLAMQVAELQRTDPSAAYVAALRLAPATQDHAVDRHDPARPRPTRVGTRPERRGAPTRDRALW
jgi:murein DD-endopeptidase MepM/ murein hydrolase activator NlpD